MAFFAWLEDTAVSTWIRESPHLWGFPLILYLHTLGLALIAGLSSAVGLAILVIPDRLADARLSGVFRLIWIGLAINVLSGIALLLAYPAKALTNPVFYIKLLAIAAAVGIVQWLERRLGASRAAAAPAMAATAVSRLKPAGWSLLGLWLVAIVTGRLLAYTHSILLASFPGSL